MRKSKRYKPFSIIRDLLVVSQRDLAKYLEISPSLLTLSEKSERELPRRASSKLSSLQDMVITQVHGIDIEKVQPTAATDLKTKSVEMAEKLSGKIALQRGEIRKCKRELSHINKLKELQHHWLAVIEKKLSMLEDELSVSPGDEQLIKDRLWFSVQQDQFTEKMHANHNKQIALQLKIALQQATADVHFTFCQRLKKGVVTNL